MQLTLCPRGSEVREAHGAGGVGEGVAGSSPPPAGAAAVTTCGGKAAASEFQPIVSRTLASAREAANLRVYAEAPDFKTWFYFFAKPTAGQRKHLFSTFVLSLHPPLHPH